MILFFSVWAHAGRMKPKVEMKMKMAFSIDKTAKHSNQSRHGDKIHVTLDQQAFIGIRFCDTL